jgi:GNAT superfamily N-acetyltransferase
MDQTLIRWASARDIDTIVDFNQRLAHETEEMSLDSTTLRRGVERLLAEPSRRGRYLVAERADEVVGQLMHTYEWSDWRDGEIWWIQSVYVRADHRGVGIYRQLHQYLRQLAIDSAGVVGIRLYVENENRSAAEVYRRLGMVDAPYRVMQEIFSNGGR